MTGQVLTADELQRLLEAQPQPNDEAPSTFDFQFLGALLALQGEELALLFHKRTCLPGEVILHEGDVGDAAYIIWSGRVAILKGEFSSPTLLSYCKAGDVIGEMALLEGQPRSASAVALEKTQLLVTDQEGFNQLFQKMPYLRQNLLESFSVRLREADKLLLHDQKRMTHRVSELEGERQILQELQLQRQELASLLVHDLRNPLGSILGAAKVLEMTLPEDVLQDKREMLEIILSACGQMQRLVNTMLETAHLEAGEGELKLSRVNPEALIRDTTFAVTRLCQQEYTIRVEIPDGLPPLLMDRAKIELVLGNLLDQAVKYTPPGGTIRVVAMSKEKDLQVSVSDSGLPISSEESQHIFEHYSPAGEKASRRHGYGLPYCRLSVEAHGGDIWVEPAEEGGCRFSFTLPFLLADQG